MGTEFREQHEARMSKLQEERTDAVANALRGARGQYTSPQPSQEDREKIAHMDDQTFQMDVLTPELAKQRRPGIEFK